MDTPIKVTDFWDWCHWMYGDHHAALKWARANRETFYLWLMREWHGPEVALQKLAEYQALDESRQNELFCDMLAKGGEMLRRSEELEGENLPKLKSV